MIGLMYLNNGSPQLVRDSHGVASQATVDLYPCPRKVGEKIEISGLYGFSHTYVLEDIDYNSNMALLRELP